MPSKKQKPSSPPVDELVRRLSSEEILGAIEDRKAQDIIDYIETRACDPWPDHLWPQANDVLEIIAAELRERLELDRAYRDA